MRTSSLSLEHQILLTDMITLSFMCCIILLFNTRLIRLLSVMLFVVVVSQRRIPVCTATEREGKAGCFQKQATFLIGRMKDDVKLNSNPIKKMTSLNSCVTNVHKYTSTV